MDSFEQAPVSGENHFFNRLPSDREALFKHQPSDREALFNGLPSDPDPGSK
jgi:hypothetical protein